MAAIPGVPKSPMGILIFVAVIVGILALVNRVTALRDFVSPPATT